MPEKKERACQLKTGTLNLQKYSSKTEPRIKDVEAILHTDRVEGLIVQVDQGYDVQWNRDLKQAIALMNTAAGGSKTELLKTITPALAEKKKDKLLKNSKYKDKIKSYLAALDLVFKVLKDQEQGVKGATSGMTDDWVEKEFPASRT